MPFSFVLHFFRRIINIGTTYSLYHSKPNLNINRLSIFLGVVVLLFLRLLYFDGPKIEIQWLQSKKKVVATSTVKTRNTNSYRLRCETGGFCIPACV